MNSFFDDYLTYVDNTEPPKVYHKWVALSLIASCLQRKCYVDWGTDRVHSNLYIVLVGPPGARKGTAMRPAMRLLNEAGIPIAAETGTREGLMMNFYENCQNTIVYEDDKETVIKECINHHSLTGFIEELTVFTRRKDEDLLNALIRWYDCPTEFKYSTIKRGILSIPNLWFNFLGATTPDTLQSQLSPALIGTGFTSRIIFVYANRKDKLVAMPSKSKNEEQQRAGLLTHMSRMLNYAGPIEWSDGFLKVYSQWYKEQEMNPPFSHVNNGIFSGYLNRRATHFRKIAMLLAASRVNFEYCMLESDFTDALLLFNEIEKSMVSIFEGVGESKLSVVITRMLRMIALQTQKNEPIGDKELRRTFMLDLVTDEYDKVITTLQKAGWIRIEASESGELKYHYVGLQQKQ